MIHTFHFGPRFRPSPPTPQERMEYEERCRKRARKAALAKQEADRCKANARRLIAAAKAQQSPR